MTYIDGFVVAVPTVSRETYREFARRPAEVSGNPGASRVVGCGGDDGREGKATSSPMAVKLQKDKTVVFSWIAGPSRETRDAGRKKVMAAPRPQPAGNPMPFD